MVRDYESRVGGAHEFNKHIPLQRDGKPEEVAELIVWLLSEKSSYITGTVQSIDGGWNS